MNKKRTKIVCTLGPSSHTVPQLLALVKAGMNVCRFNFSHGSHEDHGKMMRAVREVSKKLGEPLTILQDLQGPRIRVGDLPAEGIMLEKGKEVVFTTSAGTAKKIHVTHPTLHKEAKPGEMILLDDGLLSAKIVRISGKDLICEVTNGGKLTSHKGVNLPNTAITLSSLTEKDREDVAFGVEMNVDWIALSFVRSAKDIEELRRVIQLAEEKQKIRPEAPIRIIAKIEKPEAVENLAEIIAAADGIMVARGDLGIELPAAKVPVIQKQIIRACFRAAKPVIVATQMLDSMIRNPRPTRAEVSDIANAVIDRTDATMLSGETASGAYPLEAVTAMASAILEVEATDLDDVPVCIEEEQEAGVAMTNIANVLAKASRAQAILVASLSGAAAGLVSRYHPNIPLYVATPVPRVMHQMNLLWGVTPFSVPRCKTVSELIKRSVDHLMEQKLLKKGDEFIVVAGDPIWKTGHVNLVELRTA